MIWLHNLHGYYIHVGLLFDYLRSCGKQIIWTLHDCWAFTGNCPYFPVGCEKWKPAVAVALRKRISQGPSDASRKNYLRKKALFTGIENLFLEVPSEWLANLVRESFLKDYPIRVVPNKVDTGVFHPTKSDFRQRMGLEGSFRTGRCNVWEPRKGFADFRPCRTAAG